MIFGTNLSTLDIEFFTSELLKVSQDTIPLNLHCRTLLIPNNFFEHILHIGCAVSLHSITNSGLIAGGQNSSRGKTDGILHSRESHEYRSKGSARACFDQTTSCIVQAKVEKAPGYGVLGSIYNSLNGKDWSSIEKIERNHPLRYTPSFLYLESCSDGSLKKSYTWRCMCHLDHRRRFLTKIIGFMNWILKSLEAAKIPNKSNQNLKANFQERWDP